MATVAFPTVLAIPVGPVVTDRLLNPMVVYGLEHIPALHLFCLGRFWGSFYGFMMRTRILGVSIYTSQKHQKGCCSCLKFKPPRASVPEGELRPLEFRRGL
jgi:hypothetical protein